MNFFALACLLAVLAVSNATPNYGNMKRPSIPAQLHKANSRYVTKAGYGDNQDCIFLSNYKVTKGELVHGNYSYRDPNGFVILITYNVSADGSNYQDRRQIITNFEMANKISDEVVTTVISNLRPIVINTIYRTVNEANADLSDFDNLVRRIMIRLRTIVTSAVRNALSNYQQVNQQNINSQDLIDRILLQLEIIVKEGLKKEVETIKIQQTEEDVIKQVTDNLKVTFVLNISQILNTLDSNELQDNAAIVEFILQKIRPQILQAIQNALAKTGTTHLQIDLEALTRKILLEITPFLRRVVRQQILVFQNQRQTADESDIVESVTLKLRPIIINIIKETIERSGNNIDIQSIIEAVIQKLRIIVTREVQTILSTSEKYQSLNVPELSSNIIIQLRPLVSQTAAEQLLVVREETDDIVQRITQKMQPLVIREIQSVVGGSKVNVTDEQGFIQAVTAKLSEMVLKEVKAAIGRDTKYDAQAISQEIMDNLSELIQSHVRSAIQRFTTNVANIIIRLRPYINNKIRNADTSLPINLDINIVVNQIIEQLRPLIESIIRDHTANASGELALSARDLFEEVLVQLESIITTQIQNALRGIVVTQLDASQSRQVMTAVLNKLKPKIRPATEKILELRQNDANSEDVLVELVIEELGDTVVFREMLQNEINQRIGSLPSETILDRILAQLLSRIESMIIHDIRAYQQRQTSQISNTVMQQLISSVLSDVELLKKLPIYVTDVMTTSSQLDDNSIINQVLSAAYSFIIERLEHYIGELRIEIPDSFYTSVTFRSIIQGIIIELEKIIQQEILKNRGQKPVSKVTAIFGFGGPNTVKVKTPNYNYGYELEK